MTTLNISKIKENEITKIEQHLVMKILSTFDDEELFGFDGSTENLGFFASDTWTIFDYFNITELDSARDEYIYIKRGGEILDERGFPVDAELIYSMGISNVENTLIKIKRCKDVLNLLNGLLDIVEKTLVDKKHDFDGEILKNRKVLQDMNVNLMKLKEFGESVLADNRKYYQVEN